MKKIIFGAGNYGHMALEYYGSENVSYFVDNNLEKVGSCFFEKKVLSFDEYLEISNDYTTVIAVNACDSIARQLKNAGVDIFEYFSPQYTKEIERIKDHIGHETGTLTICGINEFTDIIISTIRSFGIDESRIRLTDFDISEESLNEEAITTVPFKKIKKSEGCYIISGFTRAYAMQVALEHKLGNDAVIINPFTQKKYYETKELIYDPYNGCGIQSEQEWNSFNKNNKYIDAISEYVDELAKIRPLFEHVEIETYNRCNGGCSFCPVSKGNDIRPERKMEWALFKKIINELSEMSYSGRLALFSNNEPFLDDRILEFHEYARKHLPNARMHLFTNGTLLTLDRFIELMKYLDELIIDNYNTKLALNKNCKDIQDYCNEHPKMKEKVTIVLRNPLEILSTRGGDAPNRKNMPVYGDVKCVLPFKQLIIRPDGKISLCCNDPYGRTTLGDVNDSRLIDIWYGIEFEDIRHKLLGGRKNISHCVRCDSFILF